MLKRQGFALISAILIVAFMLAMVAGIGATLTSQMRSQAQAGVSKKAFYYAEAALQEAFLAACNSADETGIRTYLLNPSNSSLAWNENGVYASRVVGDARAFTWVKAKPVFTVDDHGHNTTTVLRYEFIAEGVICDSALTASQVSSGTGFNVLARRVITLAASGLSVAKQGSVFKYGLFGGGSIAQNGNSNYKGDPPGINIYSAGNITMNGGTTLTDINVFAHGTVNANVTDGTIEAHARELTVAPIDFAYWQSQFVAFLKGTSPYDGIIPAGSAVGEHMDTSDVKVRTAISKYLIGKASGVEEPFGYLYTTPGEVAALWTALSSVTQPETGPFSLSEGGISEDQYAQLHGTFSTTVFYVEDFAGGLNVTIPPSDVRGVLVCPGGMTLNAKGNGGAEAVFICSGDLTFNGKGFFIGTFYTDGDAAFTQNGSGTVHGSIIAPNGRITFNGKEDVTLVNFAEGNVELDEQFQSIETMSSGWAEADYGAFKTF